MFSSHVGWFVRQNKNRKNRNKTKTETETDTEAKTKSKPKPKPKPKPKLKTKTKTKTKTNTNTTSKQNKTKTKLKTKTKTKNCGLFSTWSKTLAIFLFGIKVLLNDQGYGIIVSDTNQIESALYMYFKVSDWGRKCPRLNFNWPGWFSLFLVPYGLICLELV